MSLEYKALEVEPWHALHHRCISSHNTMTDTRGNHLAQGWSFQNSSIFTTEAIKMGGWQKTTSLETKAWIFLWGRGCEGTGHWHWHNTKLGWGRGLRPLTLTGAVGWHTTKADSTWGLPECTFDTHLFTVISLGTGATNPGSFTMSLSWLKQLDEQKNKWEGSHFCHPETAQRWPKEKWIRIHVHSE